MTFRGQLTLRGQFTIQTLAVWRSPDARSNERIDLSTVGQWSASIYLLEPRSAGR